MNEILQAIGYAALVYLMFNYLVSFGSGRPLVEWINPGRRYLPILAGTLAGGAYTSLLVATRKYKQTHLELIEKLVSEEKAPPEVVGALSCVTLGLAIAMLAVWCWWYLPRAPQTFNTNPNDLVREYRRALRHYVKWTGGLDFAILCEIRNGSLTVLAEGADDKSIRRGLNRLPSVAIASGIPPDAEPQKAIWRKLASEILGRWKAFNEALLPARQGGNVSICFDLRHGACYAEMIEEETGPETLHTVGLLLFAASLNQHEVGSMTAARHFNMLAQALRHIRTGVAKG